jgi:phage recombination protein Bet
MTTTDIATRNGQLSPHQQAALAIEPGQVTWNEVQEAALAQIGLKDASPADRAVFLHVCQRTGLDPFSAQIYMIPRKEWDSVARAERVKWSIQTGIKGLRVIRDRAERRYGVRGVLSRFTYYDTDENEHKVWTRPLPPVACEVTYTVRDGNGVETPYTSVLRFLEYQQHNKDGKAMAQWAPDQKPVHMLEKCCEADVYNKAFPQDFAGVYLDDAMPPPEPVTEAPLPQRVTAAEIRQRAARAHGQPVRSVTVPPPPEDAPWPGDAAPARAARNADRATGEVIPDGDDPRAAVLAAFDALGVAGPEIPAYLTRWSGHEYASPESLSRAAATWFSGKLAGLGSRDELEAVVVVAEARREQDAEGEASGE